MSGLGNVLTGFIGGAAGGLVAIGGIQRLREKRDAMRRRKEAPEEASEEPAHSESRGESEVPGPRSAESESARVGAPRHSIDDIATRLAEAETALAGTATALSAHEAQLAQFAERFERVMGKAAKRPGAAAERDEPVVTFAAFLRELDEAGFDPEAAAATAEQRAAHRAAREAAEKAEHWLGRTRDDDRARQVYAAVGEGRKALIRLDALRRGRPVPLAYLDQAELSGFVDAASAPYTGDRFHWAGRKPGEIMLDRPRHGKPVLVEVRRESGKSYMLVVESEKTDRTVRQEYEHFMAEDEPLLYLVAKPGVTHLGITGQGRWTVTAVEPAGLPKTAEALSGRGAAAYRHRLGAREVTVQGTDDANFQFYPDCTCQDVCKVTEHWNGKPVAVFNGAFRQDLKLPGSRGVLLVAAKAKTLWSLNVVTDH